MLEIPSSFIADKHSNQKLEPNPRNASFNTLFPNKIPAQCCEIKHNDINQYTGFDSGKTAIEPAGRENGQIAAQPLSATLACSDANRQAAIFDLPMAEKLENCPGILQVCR